MTPSEVLLEVRPLGAADRGWVDEVVRERWGLPVVTPVAVHHRPADLDGFVAWRGDERLGFVTSTTDGRAREVVVLESVVPRVGAGRALMEAVRTVAWAERAERVWLITTDDNPGALAFYERIGMVQVRVLPRFVDRVRSIKPSLPADAFRDAIELEWRLDAP